MGLALLSTPLVRNLYGLHWGETGSLIDLFAVLGGAGLVAVVLGDFNDRLRRRQGGKALTPRTFLGAAALWALCGAVIVGPGGIITQEHRGRQRIEANLSASPLKQICYVCGAPATQAASYTDGSTRYYLCRAFASSVGRA